MEIDFRSVLTLAIAAVVILLVATFLLRRQAKKARLFDVINSELEAVNAALDRAVAAAERGEAPFAATHAKSDIREGFKTLLRLGERYNQRAAYGESRRALSDFAEGVYTAMAEIDSGAPDVRKLEATIEKLEGILRDRASAALRSLFRDKGRRIFDPHLISEIPAKLRAIVAAGQSERPGSSGSGNG